jgi:hypothetical protein
LILLFTAFMTIYYIILQKEFAIARVIMLIVYIILRFLQSLQLAIARQSRRAYKRFDHPHGQFYVSVYAPSMMQTYTMTQRPPCRRSATTVGKLHFVKLTHEPTIGQLEAQATGRSAEFTRPQRSEATLGTEEQCAPSVSALLGCSPLIY